MIELIRIYDVSGFVLLNAKRPFSDLIRARQIDLFLEKKYWKIDWSHFVCPEEKNCKMKLIETVSILYPQLQWTEIQME
jgi:hypothetical protein